MKTILSIENLSKNFSGLSVLSGISMEIYQGERHAIIGPNGAGKSTLFNIITGMFKPTGGTIRFLQKDITGQKAHKIARLGISRSFQLITIFPNMTVYQNVRNAMVSKFNRRFNWTSILDKNKEIAQECERVLELISLDDVRDAVVAELSYGRQRQVELALTVARNPLLIMLDEPTAGLSSKVTKDTVQMIKRIAEGKTLVMVEHDMDVVFDLADRITVLNDGKMLATGSPAEIRDNEEVKNAYLGREKSAPQGQ